MDKYHAVCLMGMRIFFGGSSMCSPPCMTDSKATLKLAIPDCLFQVPYFTGTAFNLYSVAVKNSYACRIIAPVFKPFKPFYNYRDSVFLSYVTYNPAHITTVTSDE